MGNINDALWASEMETALLHDIQLKMQPLIRRLKSEAMPHQVAYHTLRKAGPAHFTHMMRTSPPPSVISAVADAFKAWIDDLFAHTSDLDVDRIEADSKDADSGPDDTPAATPALRLSCLQDLPIRMGGFGIADSVLLCQPAYAAALADHTPLIIETLRRTAPAYMNALDDALDSESVNVQSPANAQMPIHPLYAQTLDYMRGMCKIARGGEFVSHPNGRAIPLDMNELLPLDDFDDNLTDSAFFFLLVQHFSLNGPYKSALKSLPAYVRPDAKMQKCFTTILHWHFCDEIGT